MLSIRISRDLTQQEMADIVGVSLRYYSDLENGKSKDPSFAVIAKAIDNLQMTYSEFAGRPPNERAELFLELVRLLTAMNEDELGAVLLAARGAPSARSRPARSRA